MCKVKRKFITPDGEIKTQEELTEEEFKIFAQKVADGLTPFIYESVLKEEKNWVDELPYNNNISEEEIKDYFENN